MPRALESAPAGAEDAPDARRVGAPDGDPGSGGDAATTFAGQLAVVKALRASGAPPDRLRAANAALAALKKALRAAVPSGTAGRRKKRRAMYEHGAPSSRRDLGGPPGARQHRHGASSSSSPSSAEYPPPDPPPLDAEGYVLAFDVPHAADLAACAAQAESEAEDDEDLRSDQEDLRSDLSGCSVKNLASSPASPRRSSWSPSSASDALSFFRRFGFVVFRGVLTPRECELTRAEIWDAIERRHGGGDERKDGGVRLAAVRRDDPRTYGAMSSKTYGLAPDPAVFTERCVRNRQSPSALRCLALTLGLADVGDALVSHDRWCLYRPTVFPDGDGFFAPEAGGGGGVGSDAASTSTTLSRPEWRTRENLHLDLNPWVWEAGDGGGVGDGVGRASDGELKNDADAGPPSAAARGVSFSADGLAFDSIRDFSRETNMVCRASGPHVQGALTLADCRAKDGGTVIVPGFHRVFARWARALRAGGDEAGDEAGAESSRAEAALVDAHSDWGSDRLVRRKDGAASFKFGDANAKIHALKHRVATREGSFLIWDQRTAHGSVANRSARCRIAQFLKAFRRDGAARERILRRARRIEEELISAGTRHAVTELGERVFGLDALREVDDGLVGGRRGADAGDGAERSRE